MTAKRSTSKSKFLAYAKYVLAGLFLFVAAWPLINPVQPEPPSVRSTLRGKVIGETVTADEEREIAQRVQQLWTEFMDLHPEKARSAFEPGATEQQILAVEKAFGVPLPPDYRAFLKLCNGMRYHPDGVYPPMSSTEELVWGYNTHNDTFGDYDTPRRYEIDPKSREVHFGDTLWHPALIVIADMDGFGLVLELESGKILWWDHDGWGTTYNFDSFIELLEKSIQETNSENDPVWGRR